jgi:hypothetical protein
VIIPHQPGISSNRLIGHHHYSSRRIAVPKVFGLHEIEVPPGVTPEEHEQFLTKVLASAPVLPGWKTYLLRGERGERAGKLLLLHEIETVEARDRYFPGPEEVSEEWGQFVEQNPEAAVWERVHPEPHNRTDYIVVVDLQPQSRSTES